MLSSRTRQSLERRIDDGSIVVHGTKQFGLEVLKPFPASTVALDADRRPIKQEPQIYASDNIDVGAFCATTWSRDGCSGWFTYDTQPKTLHEFFAAPYVLREACFALGALYVAKRNRFKESTVIPGEYVAQEEVPIEEEYPVYFDDIHQYVYRSVHMAYDLRRAQRAKRPVIPLDTGHLLQLNPQDDPRLKRSPNLGDNWYQHHAFLDQTYPSIWPHDRMALKPRDQTDEY
jgi:hypothetical protein